jgi:hypothetical protein
MPVFGRKLVPVESREYLGTLLEELGLVFQVAPQAYYDDAGILN